MERIQARAIERAKIVDQIARILYENGEMLADTEGGAMPGWDEVVAELRAAAAAATSEYHDMCVHCWLSHTHQADALLRIDAAGSLTLATLLIGNAQKLHTSIEMDLWHKIERAKGFEPGSLTGAPGVKQRSAL
jgi:hypothetical protein